MDPDFPNQKQKPGVALIGTTIGHYTVKSLIGAGGMGEVYCANDKRLRRDVAIKVLPAGFSQDADRLRRFEQEARAAGMLNHPNILTVYDIGAHEGAPYIVSELLEGATLRQRLADGPLPAHRAGDYAVQIARGLIAAHGKGIVHRDLKPENLFVTTDGRIKILDFGLAKLKRPTSYGVDPESPTNDKTQTGVVLGTAGYMSPEQVRGQDIDHRSDIFAFGAILYEMLTGKRAFEGATSVEVLNAILKEEPSPAAGSLNAISPGLDRVLRRCLEKDPPARFQSTSDLAFSVETAFATPGASRRRDSLDSQSVAPGRVPASRLWPAATLVLLLATLALGWLNVQPVPDSQVIQFSIPPPEGSTFIPITDIPYSAAVSPDGKHLALVVITGGRPQLWVRPLDSLTARPLAGTEGAANPFWSSDSRYIAFFANGQLKRINVEGGSPQTLSTDTSIGRNTIGTWGRDGDILFANIFALYRVPARGGPPVAVTKPSTTLKEYLWPLFLSDGRRYLILPEGVPRSRPLYAGSLDTDERTLLLKDASRTAYSRGYLLYVRDGTLLAHPFDARTLTPRDEPIVLAEGLWFFKPTGSADFSVSENGVLVYRAGTNLSRLAWFDRRGTEVGTLDTAKDFVTPRISRDEQRVAVMVQDPRTGTSDIVIYDLARRVPTQFTSEPGTENTPVWSPDERRIVFGADVGGPPHLYLKGINESGSGQMLLPIAYGLQDPFDWASDGRILFGGTSDETGADLMVLAPGGKAEPTTFLGTKFNEAGARLSRDNRWVAYVSDESGTPEVYVCSFSDACKRERVQISTGGGANPRWRSDGRELFYIAADKRLIAVPVGSGEIFTTGKPNALFQVNARFDEFEVAGDGERFLVNVSVVDANALPLTVVVNWDAKLKK